MNAPVTSAAVEVIHHGGTERKRNDEFLIPDV
jgi:hypothetical protein